MWSITWRSPPPGSSRTRLEQLHHELHRRVIVVVEHDLEARRAWPRARGPASRLPRLPRSLDGTASGFAGSGIGPRIARRHAARRLAARGYTRRRWPSSSSLDGVRALPRGDVERARRRRTRPSSSGSGSPRSRRAGCVGPRRAGRRARSCCARAAASSPPARSTLKGHSEGEFVFDWGWADAAAARGHRLLPEAPGRACPSRRSRARACSRAPGADRARAAARARRARCASSASANELSGVARELLPRRRARRARRRGLPAAPRLPVPLDATAASRASRTTWARCAASAATRCAASGASSRRRACAIESLTGDAIPDALFAPMFEIYLTHGPSATPGAGST